MLNSTEGSVGGFNPEGVGVSVEADVRWLVERQKIVDLKHRWCHFVDSFQLQRLVDETYAPDGIDDHGGGPVQGREAIRAWYEDSTANVATVSHNISNILVEIDGDKATMRSNVVTLTWTMANANGDPQRAIDYGLSLSYEDKLTRYPEGWLFDAKVLVSNRSKDGGSHVVAFGSLPGTQTGIQALTRKAPPVS
jgi:hypothetical protein